MAAGRITERSFRRMEACLRAEIRHYEQCLALIRSLPPEVLIAGRELFRDERALALWLCEPVHALGGRVPLFHLRSATQRAQVVNLLRALVNGTIL